MKKLAATVSAFLLAFCLASPAMAGGEWVIGAVTPLSGKISVYGEGFQRAMLLAAAEINAAGGVAGKKIKIIFEDNTSTAKGSISALQKLITVHKVPVVFGPAASSNFLAACPVAQRSKVVFIGAESAAAAISKCGSYVFRVFPSDKLQGIGAAKLAISLGYKKVALTYINNDWGVGLGEVFKKAYTAAGGKIVEEFAHSAGKPDYRSELLRLKKSGAGAVVNLTYIKEAATILKQAYEMKYKVQWLMGSASKSAKMVALAGKAAEGVIGTYPTFALKSPQYKAYKAAWAKKYPGKKMAIFGEYNYDMVKLTAKALSLMKGKFTADNFRAALIKASKGYKGVTGIKTFDKSGDVGATYGRWTVKGGKIKVY